MKFLGLKDSVTTCPYLPERKFTAENFITHSLDADEIDRLLEAGFRHFGSYYFRPVCDNCGCCVPLRVDVRHHGDSRAERRTMRANRDLVTVFSDPAPSLRAFSLYRMHQQRFECSPSATYEQFVSSFFSPTFGNTQLSVFSDGLLVSVLHLDVTGTSVSAVYCYYDTGLSRRSLGTYTILTGLHFAAQLRVSRYYLGYVVRGNRHMEYKSRFKPNEILVRDGWVPFKSSAGETINLDKYVSGFPGAWYRSARPFPAILFDR